MKHTSLGSRIFDTINYSILTIFALATVLPFVHVIASSFATSEEILSRQLMLFPHRPSLDAYKYIFTTNVFMNSLMVSIFITVVGTLINILFTSLMAYSLGYEGLVGRRVLLFLVVFTMMFGGGMMPTFLLVKSLGMLNKFSALLIPGAISAFNLIVLKNFFQQLPKELGESAKIDGAHDLVILFRIVFPLSLPALATFSLFYAVGHWNTFFTAVLYINDSHKWPIQVLLRQIVILSQGGFGDSDAVDPNIIIPPESIRMAVIVVASIPIMLVYPFLQKHFTQGVLMGSVKG